MIKRILFFLGYNILTNNEYYDYLDNNLKIKELEKTIRNLKVTITDLKKKDYYELYKQQLVTLNRLRANIQSLKRSRNNLKNKYLKIKEPK